MYLKQKFPCNSEFSLQTNSTNSNRQTASVPSVVALQLDFVAKPEGTTELNRQLGILLERAGLVREGLETALLLVSDREARLVTLLTFWDTSRFSVGREQRIACMQKLLSPFSDGPLRVQTCAPQLVLSEPSAALAMKRPAAAASLAQVGG